MGKDLLLMSSEPSFLEGFSKILNVVASLVWPNRCDAVVMLHIKGQ